MVSRGEERRSCWLLAAVEEASNTLEKEQNP